MSAPVPESRPASARPDEFLRRELPVLLLLALLAAASYARLFQPWLSGDGPQIVQTYLFGARRWMHVLYLPAVQALEWLSGWNGLDSLRACSILGGALAVAGTTCLARRLGHGLGAACVAGLLCATTPVVVYFATTIEINALHTGVVACVLALLVRVRAAARVTELATLALTVPLLYLTHKSAALFAPGLLVLSGPVTRASLFTPRRWLAPFLVIAAAFYASIRLGQALVPQNSIGDTLAFIERFDQPLRVSYLRESLWNGLGPLLPLALVGLWRSRGRGAGWMAALLGPMFAFFLWYGEANRGAYFLSSVPLLAVLALRALPAGRAGVVLGLVALLAQASLARDLLAPREAAGTQALFELRVERARAALGEEGKLLSFRSPEQPVTLALPGVQENSMRTVLVQLRSGEPLERVVAGFVRLLEQERASGTRVALDLGPPPALGRELRTLLEAFERELETRYGAIDRSVPAVPILVLR